MCCTGAVLARSDERWKRSKRRKKESEKKKRNMQHLRSNIRRLGRRPNVCHPGFNTVQAGFFFKLISSRSDMEAESFHKTPRSFFLFEFTFLRPPGSVSIQSTFKFELVEDFFKNFSFGVFTIYALFQRPFCAKYVKISSQGCRLVRRLGTNQAIKWPGIY